MVGWGSMCILPSSLSAASWLTVRHLSIRDWSWVRSFYKKKKNRNITSSNFYIRILSRCWQYPLLFVSNYTTTLIAWDLSCEVSGFCLALIVTRARGFGLRPTPKIPDAFHKTSGTAVSHNIKQPFEKSRNILIRKAVNMKSLRCISRPIFLWAHNY